VSTYPRPTGLALVLVLAGVGIWGGPRALAARAHEAQAPPQQTQAPSQAPTFRSNVERVTVDAVVVDDDGKPGARPVRY
jgi:uncharacterized protein (DUF1786 family)